MACYDFEYLDAKVIGGVQKALPSVAEIMRQTEKRATGKVTTVSQTSLRESQDGQTTNLNNTGLEDGEIVQDVKMVTVPQPFNLTNTKPKMIPLPHVIKREVKANPVPKNMNRVSLADVEQHKRERR